MCASVFGDLNYFLRKGGVYYNPKMAKPHETLKMDYYLFTNIPKEELKPYIEDHWQVININVVPNNNIKNNTQLSRYYKFQLHHYFAQQNKTDYDWIIYIDHYLLIAPNVDWCSIVEPVIQKASDTNLALIQTFHKDGYNNIKLEAQMIIRGNADTKQNVENGLNYLQSLDPSVNLNKDITFSENWFFLYSPKHKPTVDHFDLFWGHYLNPKYSTKRDQPLWNYLLHYRKPRIHNTIINLIKYICNINLAKCYHSKFAHIP